MLGAFQGAICNGSNGGDVTRGARAEVYARNRLRIALQAIPQCFNVHSVLRGIAHLDQQAKEPRAVDGSPTLGFPEPKKIGGAPL